MEKWLFSESWTCRTIFETGYKLDHHKHFPEKLRQLYYRTRKLIHVLVLDARQDSETSNESINRYKIVDINYEVTASHQPSQWTQ